MRRMIGGTWHYTPVDVVWKIRQSLTGGYVPLQNPPFETETQKANDYEL